MVEKKESGNRSNKRMIRVPYEKQKTDYTCGPSTIRMILEFFGIRESEIRLAHQAHTNKKTGTEHSEMINLVRRHGFYCYVHNNSNIHTIKHFITRGFPVIINYIEPLDDFSHFSIIIGYERDKMIMNDPLMGKNFKITDEEFNKRWVSENYGKKWIMIVSKEPIIQGKQYNPKC